MVEGAHGLADVVAQAGDDELVVGACSFRAGRGLEAVRETAKPSVTSASDRSISRTRSAARAPWFLVVSAPITAHCSAVDSSIRVKVCAIPLYCPFVDLEALSSLELADSEGAPRRLGDFWAERPVILVFLRHFG
jgi:hypothetical protein